MRVAVLGAGYAGLALARSLERRLPPEAGLVVVDENDYHLVQHEIHRAIRRPAVSDDLRVPLADVLSDATVRQARVTDVDPQAGVATINPAVPVDGDVSAAHEGSKTEEQSDGPREVEYSGETERLEYDVGVVALGAQTNYYDLPGVPEYGTPLKRLADAAEIRADVLDVLDSGGGRVVVGGAGLSGIQTAGELSALAHEEAAGGSVDILLLEQASAVAPNFPANFQRAVEDQLVDRGVTVRTNATVTKADAETLILDDSEGIEHDAFIWTGGIRGQDAMGGERPVVRDRLRYERDTFVIGDAAAVVDTDGSAVPASAQSAVREAGVAADNVERLVDYKLGDRDGFEPRLDRFQFDSPGWLVSVGDGAVAQVGSVVLTGAAAIALKTTVGAGYLTTVGEVRKAVGLVREEVEMATSPVPEEVEEELETLPDPVDLQEEDG